jgi:hypothetical protein
VKGSVEGKLYFNAGNRVGTIQNALGPVLPPGNIFAPYYTAFEVVDAFAVPTPSRFGAIV